MIVRLNREEIDDDKWNKCIRQSQFPLVYAQSWYLDVVSENWMGLVLNDYDAVMPIPVRHKYFITYAYIPFWTQQMGVFSKGNTDEELIDAFLSALPKEIRYADLSMQAKNQIPDDYPKRTRPNYVLEIPESEQALNRMYNTQTKRNIKKAKGAKLNILQEQNPEEIVKLFRANKGAELDEVKDSDYKSLVALLHAAIYHRQAAIWSAYDERNQLVAGAAFLIFRGRVTLILAASNQVGKETGAMSLLINMVQEESIGYMSHFDFEGSEISGLARFYSGFGAEAEYYYHVKINKLPKPISWLKK